MKIVIPFKRKKSILTLCLTTPPPVAMILLFILLASIATSVSIALNPASPDSWKISGILLPALAIIISSKSKNSFPSFSSSILPIVVLPALGIPINTMLQRSFNISFLISSMIESSKDMFSKISNVYLACAINISKPITRLMSAS